jgi:hypothetical protein
VFYAAWGLDEAEKEEKPIAMFENPIPTSYTGGVVVT